MKPLPSLALSLSLLLFMAPAFAAAGPAAPRTYRVTGPVLVVTDDLIVVQNGNEKWEIALNKYTKVFGDLKVGARVTIEYRMIASNAEAKGDPAQEKPAGKPAATKSKAAK